MLSMPVEKSGQNEFDFEYGDDFGDHIEEFDPDFSKVLVRYNPDGDAEMNERQTERLKRLSDWLHENDRKFLFELLVPAEDRQLEQVGGDADRYDAELRPELMRRTIEDFQDAGVEADIWKIEGIDTQRGLRDDRRQTARRDGRDGVVCVRARPRRQRRQGRPLAARRARRSTATRASRSAARSGGTPSRASSTAIIERDDAARADRRQLHALRRGLRGARSSSAAPRALSVGAVTLVAFRARCGCGSPLRSSRRPSARRPAESVVRREQLRKQAAQRARVAGSSASRKQGTLRFIAARARDRRHGRDRDDRDVPDAGAARRLSRRLAARQDRLRPLERLVHLARRVLVGRRDPAGSRRRPPYGRRAPSAAPGCRSGPSRP